MSNTYSRIETRKRATRRFNEIANESNRILIIHYSCESFYDIPEGRSARITSIGIKYFNTGQCTSFSIHKIVEKIPSISFNEIESHYDQLEKMMLDEFFEFVGRHQDFYWIHWNMRDINFGFEALKHRHHVLGGEPTLISNDKKIDLSSLLIDKYSPKYAGHPRLQKLVEMNRISTRDFMTGAEEAMAFEKKKFVELHKSTLKKIDIMNNLLIRTMNNTLKTNAKFKDSYGLSPTAVMELIKSYWGISLLIWIIGIILGGLFSAWIGLNFET